MKIFSFTTEYKASVTYLVGGTVPKLLAYLKKKYGGKLPKVYSWDKEFTFGDDADTTDGYQFHVNAPLGDGEMFYVWIAEPSSYLLSHETYHLVGDILFTRGIEYNYGAEESYAYLMSSIFEEIFKKMRGKIPKKQ